MDGCVDSRCSSGCCGCCSGCVFLDLELLLLDDAAPDCFEPFAPIVLEIPFISRGPGKASVDLGQETALNERFLMPTLKMADSTPGI